MIVAFWSMDKGKRGTTAGMIGTAIASSLRHNVKILLLDTSFGETTIQQSFMDSRCCMMKESVPYFNGIGIDYLIHTSKNNILNSETVREGMVPVRENLAYVPGTQSKNRDQYEQNLGLQCENIVSHLELQNDYIFLDCGNECSDINNKLLKLAHVVVVNLLQSKKDLDEFFQTRPFFFDKMIYLIGSYEADVKCNIAYIKHFYRIEDDCIGMIPDNEEYLSALQKGKALQYFKYSRNTSKFITYHEFQKQVTRSGDMILRKVEKVKKR